MNAEKGVKPRVAILGAGALTSHIASLLASVADVEVAQVQEDKVLTLRVSRSPDVSFLSHLPKEKAQWKRERKGR